MRVASLAAVAFGPLLFEPLQPVFEMHCGIFHQRQAGKSHFHSVVPILKLVDLLGPPEDEVQCLDQSKTYRCNSGRRRRSALRKYILGGMELGDSQTGSN